MKYTCPQCGKVIEADTMYRQVMEEIFEHEKTHSENKDKYKDCEYK